MNRTQFSSLISKGGKKMKHGMKPKKKMARKPKKKNGMKKKKKNGAYGK